MVKNVYDNEKCPICEADHKVVSSWVHCKKNSSLVCMKHCFNECQYFSGERCKFKKE